MAKNFVMMESNLDKYVEDKMISLLSGGGDFAITTAGDINGGLVRSSGQMHSNSNLSVFNGSHILVYNTENTGYTIALRGSDGYIQGRSFQLLNSASDPTITMNGADGGFTTTGGISIAGDFSGKIVQSVSDMRCNGNSCIYNGNQLLVSNTSNDTWNIILRGSDGYVGTNGNINAAGSISTNSYGNFGVVNAGNIVVQGSIENYGATPYIDFHKDSSTADFTSRLIENVAGSLYLYATGGAWGWFHAGGYSNESSRVVKKNIKDISENDALKLLKLRPVSFDYINGDTNRRGLIAEEVMEVYPELVKIPEGYDEDTFEYKEDGTNLVPSLEYTGLIPYLIKMVQIQQKEIEELKKKYK